MMPKTRGRMCLEPCVRQTACETSSGYERVLRAAMAKEDFAEEEGRKVNLENSRNEAQNHGENCATHRVNSNANYGL